MDNVILKGIIIGLGILCLCMAVLMTAAQWRILSKAGEKGWKALIPFYNVFVSYRVIGMSYIWLIADIIIWIAEIAVFYFSDIIWIDLVMGILTLLVTLVSEIVHINKLCDVFGKGEGFKLGTFFLPYVFIPVIGFGSSRYFPPGAEHPDKPERSGTAAEIRRLENNLMTLGGGILAVSIWSLLKVFSAILFDEDVVSSMSDPDIRIIYIVFGLAAVTVFVMCCIVGLSARAESKGKKRHYLILTGIIIFLNSILVLIEILYFFYDGFYLSSAVSIIFDITVFIFLVELMSSSIKLRRIRKYEKHSAEKGDSHEF